MINLIITTFARQMEQYLDSFFHQPEGLVEVRTIGSQTEEEPCKLLMTLLSIERETAQGVSAANKVSGSLMGISLPPISANLNVIIAAVFNDKRYRESLSILSTAITFLQANPVFVAGNGNRYTIEMMAPSLQDMSNIWAMFGGRSYPSVVCKIRRLTFDANELRQTVAAIKELNTNLK